MMYSRVSTVNSNFLRSRQAHGSNHERGRDCFLVVITNVRQAIRPPPSSTILTAFTTILVYGMLVYSVIHYFNKLSLTTIWNTYQYEIIINNHFNERKYTPSIFFSLRDFNDFTLPNTVNPPKTTRGKKVFDEKQRIYNQIHKMPTSQLIRNSYIYNPIIHVYHICVKILDVHVST